MGLHLRDALSALLILAANFAIVIVAVFVFAEFIEPGHPPAYYEEAATGIAGWTAPIGGGLLFLGVAYFRARRNSARSAYASAIETWFFYVLFDVVLGIALSAGQSVVTLQLIGSLSLALMGGLLGSWLSNRSR